MSSPPAAAEPKPRIPADIWVLVAAAFIVAIGYGIIAPVLPQFAHSFGLGVTASSIVVSSFAFFRFVCAPAGGHLVNRLGERRVYITGLLIVAASTAAVAFAQTYWQLLLFRGLGGLGSTMFTVSAMALIVRIAPSQIRARATSLYATAFLVGNIAGPVVGGAMAGLGMRIPFIVYAVALLAAAAVVFFKLASSVHTDSLSAAEVVAESETTSAGENSSAAAKPRAVAERPVMRFREAWADSAYRASLLSAFAHGWSSMGIRVAIYPLFAINVLSAGPAAAGLALTMFAIGNTVAVTAVAKWADVKGRKPFIVLGLVILGASTAVVGIAESVWLFYALSIVAGIGAGLLNPAQQAAVADVVGSRKAGGIVLSRYQMALDAGAIFGPVISGVIVDHVGYGWAFAVSGIIVLLAAGIWLTGRETLPLHSSNRP